MTWYLSELERAARDLNYRAVYESKQDNQRRTREIEATLEKSRRDSEERRRQAAAGRQDAQSKVICTHLNANGLLSRSDYLLSLRYVREHLTVRHERGYHAWAVPLVPHLRRSRRATIFMAKILAARADHIAYVYGDRTRRNRFGALLCAAFAACCWTIGGFVGEQDWRALYRDQSDIGSA